nr:hypothetical protein [uncultured Acetatifactor sp.]
MMNLIIPKIGLPATLEQLAEEAAELGQAALKVARVIRGENPTPVDYAQAVDHLQGEVGDVRLCLKVLEDAFPYALNTEANEQAKLNRWLDRLDRFQQGDRG